MTHPTSVPLLSQVAQEASRLAGHTISRKGFELIHTQPAAKVGDFGIFLVAAQSSGRVHIDGTTTSHSDAVEQTSQLLFGETYKVIGVAADSNSILVETSHQQANQFWIESHKHYGISPEIQQRILAERSEWPTTQTAGVAIPINGEPEGVVRLAPGSKLPFYDANTGVFSGSTYALRFVKELKGVSEFAPTKPSTENLVNFLIAQLGWPYDWGGTGFGVDCSGFSKRIMDHFLTANKQEALPRNAREQLMLGEDVAEKDIKTGDLVFYTRHVGVFVKGVDLVKYNQSELKWNPKVNYLFHARQLVRTEILRPEWRTEKMNPNHLFTGIRRFINFED